MTNTEIKLPSGAILTIRPASFSESKKLYQALLSELKCIQINVENLDMANMIKDLFCIGFSSPKVEECLSVCLGYCQYNDGKNNFKIDKNTFEPMEAREDYVTVCMEVARVNVDPFMKSLYAQFQRSSQMTEKSQA